MWSINFLGWLTNSLTNPQSSSQWKGDPLPLQVVLFSQTRNLLIGLCHCMMTLHHKVSVLEHMILGAVSAATARMRRIKAAIDESPVRLANLQGFLALVHVGNSTRILDLQLLCASKMPSNWHHYTDSHFFFNLKNYLDVVRTTDLSKNFRPPEVYGGQFIPDWSAPPAGITPTVFLIACQATVASYSIISDKWQCTRCAATMRDKDAGPEPTPGLGYFLAHLRRCPCGGYWQALGKQDTPPRRSIFMPLTDDPEEDSD